MPTERDIFSALKRHLAVYAKTTHQILVNQGNLDDFIQVFMLEVVRKFRVPENENKDFIDFAWKYARWLVTLPSKRVYSLIVLRGIEYSKKSLNKSNRFITKEYTELVNFIDYHDLSNVTCNPYLSIDTRLELTNLRGYLVDNSREAVVEYFDLLVRHLEKDEISSILKLSSRETGRLQESFRYYVNRYQGITGYKLKKKTLVNHRRIA